MVPILDILQSIPILSFLPVVIFALIAAFPHSNVGLELASVILIFTSQAWNMTFSFYHSVRTLPADLQEVSVVTRLRPWRRFTTLELPSSMIGLIWNSMMSWPAAGSFSWPPSNSPWAKVLSNCRDSVLTLQAAANVGNTGAILLGLLTLIILIILLDLLFWRPLVAWADKFKIEQSGGTDTPHSPVLNALRRSALLAALSSRIFAPLGRMFARILDRLQPLPGAIYSPAQDDKLPHRNTIPVRRFVNWGIVGLLGVIVLIGLWFMILLLVQVSLPTWGELVLATLATLLRTMVALAIGVAWTVPVGVAIGLSPRWSRRLQPVVQVVASIPATALFPILLLALVGLPGGLSLAAILLMLLGTQWYILFNVIAGAMSIPSDLREATSIYHATGWRKWRVLILPAIFPYLVTGMLTASGGAWNASIVSEYVQFNNHTFSTTGLGASIAAAAAARDFSVLLAATLLMAVVVVIINRTLWKRLYTLAEKRYTLS